MASKKKCVFLQVCKLQGFQPDELCSLCVVAHQLSVPCKSHSVSDKISCVMLCVLGGEVCTVCVCACKKKCVSSCQV